MVEPRRAGFVEWGVATRPYPGERASGDRCAVVVRGDGVLVAVIDALGHGAEADAVAREAAWIVERHAGAPLPALIARCHEELMGGRGAVMSAAFIDERRRTLTWAGVGNIAGVLLASADGAAARRATLVASAGIVGNRLPAVAATSVSLTAGDTLVLATDGVRRGIEEAVISSRERPQRMAERLMRAYATERDDALLFVLRYGGHA